MCKMELVSKTLLKFVITTMIPISFSIPSKNSAFGKVCAVITTNGSSNYPLPSFFKSWANNSNIYANADRYPLN
jgi:hypothetical protein